MVFVETRTTAQEVLQDIYRELTCMMNGVESDLAEFRRSGTYRVTKGAIRNSSENLAGAFRLAYMAAGGVDQVPEGLTNRFRMVRQRVRDELR